MPLPNATALISNLIITNGPMKVKWDHRAGDREVGKCLREAVDKSYKSPDFVPSDILLGLSIYSFWIKRKKIGDRYQVSLTMSNTNKFKPKVSHSLHRTFQLSGSHIFHQEVFSKRLLCTRHYGLRHWGYMQWATLEGRISRKTWIINEQICKGQT
jgi:hypothetical protein